ncbi:hypothetical protein GCM10010918_47800 [Paenibacillus radicis (ex Gao et al. 2016)]|uniref:Uncharacterized protein n=1 Tax=Paenibacillus radicis (ex Gao et al. 2016) TaxID=1737354 RepID=A0A917HNT3_9BACL|nr:hypothetical protein GCM10010918_47800 [Paenibacillus radicis (ex Gao et al. 2016)]
MKRFRAGLDGAAGRIDVVNEKDLPFLTALTGLRDVTGFKRSGSFPSRRLCG